MNNVGEGIFDVAFPLALYARTESVVVLGVAAALVPATLLLGPFLGALADARGSARLVVSGLVVQLVAATGLNVYFATSDSSVVLVIILAAVIQLAGAVYRVGWMTSVPSLFPETPTRARGSLSSLYVATTVAGPVVVGALLPVLGYVGLLWLNIATFVAPLLVLLKVRPSSVVSHADTGRAWSVTVRGLHTGIAAVKSNPVLKRLTLLLLPFDFVASAATPTLALFHLRDTLSLQAESVAFIIAVMNVAALLGALLVSERARFRPVFIVNALVTLIVLALAGASFTVTIAAVFFLVFLMFLDGAASSAQSMLTVQYVPAEVYGRASGVLRLIHGVPSLGGPIAVAAMVPAIGTSGTFLVLALVAALSGLGFVNLKRTPA